MDKKPSVAPPIDFEDIKFKAKTYSLGYIITDIMDKDGETSKIMKQMAEAMFMDDMFMDDTSKFGQVPELPKIRFWGLWCADKD